MPTGRKRGYVVGRLPIPVTSSWSTRLPDGYAAIGISRGPPRGRRGYRMYRALAPGDWFRPVDAKVFVERYMAQLAGLDADQVLHDLAQIANGDIPALLCFERPPPDTAWVWSPGGLRTPPNSTSLNLVLSRRVLAGRTQSCLRRFRSCVDRRRMYEIHLTRVRSGYFERRKRTGRSSKTLASTPSTLASFSTIVMLAL